MFEVCCQQKKCWIQEFEHVLDLVRLLSTSISSNKILLIISYFLEYYRNSAKISQHFKPYLSHLPIWNSIKEFTDLSRVLDGDGNGMRVTETVPVQSIHQLICDKLVHLGTEAGQWITHWGQDKMAAIFHTTFSDAFTWMKMYEFWLRFHWSLFLRVQLTIFQHWFR